MLFVSLPNVLNSLWLKYYTMEVLPGVVTEQTRKLGMHLFVIF